MRKLRLLIAAVFLGIFVWSVNVSAESVIIDNPSFCGISGRVAGTRL